MSIPSNTIPTKITELPLDPAPSNQGILMYVRDGVTYQVTAADIVNVSGVPTTRQVIAGTGMTGGGQLSSNVTLSIAPGGVGSTQLANSGVTAGVYGSTTSVPVVTVDATGRITAATTASISVSGFVPTSREVIAGVGLSGGGALTGNVTVNANLSSATPSPVDQTGSAGVSTNISRADHKHPAIDLADDDQVDGVLGLDNGGTGRNIAAVAGGIVWSGADGMYVGPPGSAGQVLVSAGTAAPSWGSALIVSDQNANIVYAGPTSGPAAPTSFRNLVNADLPNSGVVANTYGSSTTVPVVTVNAKGVLTSVSNVDVTPAFSNVTGKPTTLAGYGITDAQPLDSELTAIAALIPTNDNIIVGDGTTWVTESGSTARASLGVPATDGTGASGNWGISISGTAANIAGGAANRIVYNSGAGATQFITAPTTANTYLEWSGSGFQWSVNPLGTVTSVSGTGTVSGLTLTGTVTTSGNLTLGGSLDLSSPPNIGATTPAAGAFTSLTATSGISGGSF